LWLLGSSEQSAIWAAELGLPYAFADFINPEGANSARYYRSQCATPETAVAIAAICAETDDEAMRLSASVRMALIHLFRGRSIPVPPPDEALEFLSREGIPMSLQPVGRRFVTGSPATVKRSIEKIAEEYGAGEVLILTVVNDHTARRRSYELIAKEFGITPAFPTTSLPLQ
jgi:alkanesulfonate monooxygenase SsuD/methylene tetrahydromethanopterin reductase-like flavin-dependent oxidoreductase (luciferase family)